VIDIPPRLRVAIIGAGFGGIAAAIELKASRIDDVQILDSAPGLGGTWLHNSYPGSACDVPSHLYSYSFAQRRDWKRLCPLQPEILEYIENVASDYAINELIRTDTKVSSCLWDEQSGEWAVSSSDGATIRADAIVIATGQLHQPAFPKIEGDESFSGHSFHSAEWDHDYDLIGKRIAVIGTGASAVQLIPEVAQKCARLTVFQRTGNWMMPRRNRSYPKPVALAIRWLPGLQSFRRKFIFEYGETLTAIIRHPRTLGLLGRLRSSLFMRWQLRGNDRLRSQVWPDYTFGCKRVLFSSGYLPALQRSNVELVDSAITGITPTGIVTADGHEYEVDCIIYATGFKTNDFMFPMEIVGRNQQNLRDAWADGPHAHLGITVPGFPSMFLMYGPNTNTSGGSILVYLEAQAAYIRKALEAVWARGGGAVEVRAETEQASDRRVQAHFKGTAWVRCDSWYRDEAGRVVANWPGYMRDYQQQTALFDPTEYSFIEQRTTRPR